MMPDMAENGKAYLLIVSIPSNGSSLFQFCFAVNLGAREMSQSPQTGQVYFNDDEIGTPEIAVPEVSIPSNGSSLFQCFS